MIGSPSSVQEVVNDTLGNSAWTDVEKWYFNPAISISVGFSSGTQIMFPSAQAGQTVFSTNTMLIQNNAAGGVDLVGYLTGNDLIDTSGHGFCPVSNILNVSNIAYRFLVGSVQSEGYQPLPHLKESNACNTPGAIPAQCSVEDSWPLTNLLYVPGIDTSFPVQIAGINPTNSQFSIIQNGGQAQCWFRLSVPFPCAGTFSASNAVEVLVRAL